MEPPFPSGDYDVSGEVFDTSGTMLACLDIKFTIA